jgi:magnesium-transporting ATPase (P-type)
MNKLEKAHIERGISLLASLKIIVNVLFALMVFQIFLILPRPDDPELQYHTLGDIFLENLDKLLVIVVGIILIIMYWLQTNLQLGNLTRSNALHAILMICHTFFLMIYLYFVRFDMEFDGMKLALQMESIFLALAGFVGAYAWRYAKKNELTSDKISPDQEMDIFYKLLPEPIASVFTLPFAVFGPGIWTLAFLSIIPIVFLLKLIRKKYDAGIDIAD